MAKIDIDIQREALALVEEEKNAWEEQEVFVTENVAFNVRNLIRQLRKNYWGIFNTPKDPQTGRKKIWIPLTESVVDAYVKNIDLDSKDLNFKAKNQRALKLTALVRTLVRNWLDKNYFGQMLDDTERMMGIDGSAVWKTWEQDGKMKTENVDLLNLYFDMTGHESLQEKYRVTERSLMTEDELKGMEGWINLDQVEAKKNVHPTESEFQASHGGQSTSKFVDVWELWGKIPKSLISGRGKDDEEVEGHIIVSGLDAGNPLVHLVEENTDKDVDGEIKRPYEEFHTKRVSGRWLARGPAESIMMLQLWMNTIVNIRITREYVSQLGIFKIRRGSGITPQMVGRLANNGALLVNNMEDIEQFVMQDVTQGSFSEEANIRDWAVRVTSTFETVTGEALPSSTPATNTVLQSRAAASSFKMTKKHIGLSLERWMKRHALPILVKNLKVDDLVRISGDLSELEELDEKIVNKKIADQLKKFAESNISVSREQVLRARESALQKMRGLGEQRFMKLLEKIDFTEFDVEVFVTNEEFDKSVMSQNLINALQMAPQYAQPLMRQLFDLMGLNVTELERVQQQTQVMQQMQQVQGQQQAPQTEQQVATGANVPQLNQQ